jgi:hypothetical protein
VRVIGVSFLEVVTEGVGEIETEPGGRYSRQDKDLEIPEPHPHPHPRVDSMRL